MRRRYDVACRVGSEYPFKQNRSTLKNMTVLLYTYFVNISLNVLRPNFFNICNLTFLHCPNIGKIRVKVGPKTNYLSYFMSSCTNRIAPSKHFNVFLTLSFGWCDVATWDNVKSTLKQRCLFQHWNNVVIFNVEFSNVGKRRNNVVKMTASKKSKKN